MVIAEKMSKPVLKVSMDSNQSDTDASSIESAESSEDETKEADESEEDVEPDADDESASSNSEDDKSEALVKNEGWADSIAKILSSNKPKNKKTLVLSRAKKHSEVVKKEPEQPAFEVIGDVKEEKPVVKEESDVTEPAPKRVKHEKPSIRAKPNILEKDRERLLNKIATKGVVQLFNAVRNQQKTIENEVNRNDISEGKKEKILKKFDKRAFLDTLMGQSKSILVDEHTEKLKNEVKDEDKPQWSALRDDFMMGAKMKDWDKESVDD